MTQFDPACLGALGWFDVLTTDTGVLVSVVDRAGFTRYVNRVGAASLGRPAHEIIGLHISTFLPGGWAEERMQIMRRVIDSRKPIILFETYRGVRCRTTFRRLPVTDGEGCALVVLCPVTLDIDDALPEGIEVLHAQIGDHDPLEHLTQNERAVMKLLAQGLTVAEAAKQIHRSAKTVEAHRSAIGKKLGVRNRAEITQIAVRAGLVDDMTAYRPPQNERA